MAGDDNPFERYGLDPREGVVAITQRLKELAEDATDDAERERIRAAWEELTLHPARRLRAARTPRRERRSGRLRRSRASACHPPSSSCATSPRVRAP